MKRTVFYSWQSDLPNAVNRSFIETALQRALKSIQKDESESVEPVLDRDTLGVSGSPSISDEIFAKITQADVFVGDVSIINSGDAGRPTPNPNVLVELGYAVAQLGWDRVLLIQNTAFGGPEKLPFDLRGRRVIAYDLAADDTNKADVRGLLQGRIETGLRSALASSAKIATHAGTDVPLWWGHWNITDDGGMNGGNLFIYEVGPAGFLFKLTVYNGAHSGQLQGYARIVATDLAYARLENGEPDGFCEIRLRRRISESLHIIEIEETSSCLYWRGMGAVFSGTFIRKRDLLFDAGILDELDLSRLYRTLGSHYEAFRQRVQLIGELENLDPFVAKASFGGVRGLFTIMEAIVMRGEAGELWAAYIDDDVVRYFTTECDYQDKLPLTIEAWRENFKEKPVEYHVCVDFIPKNEF
ncbi:hypothetical protein Q8A64_16020 [Oxalobacteraceae bacterium R-40]|uniref:CD-NTase-associated protein 12/Pycsar effector protein TIR domain-containing protein n=1 Tax=Keguizhuia sedimenti TaxID=3064264 RepID=A0ABU1BV91_9BURK|nr:hypothetical protein [Oxalobacteraceae bacterium R-40]